jgi:hypothetical protein
MAPSRVLDQGGCTLSWETARKILTERRKTINLEKDLWKDLSDDRHVSYGHCTVKVRPIENIGKKTVVKKVDVRV